MSSAKKTVGFLGLGNLGLSMALRLAERGFDVVGCDRSESRMRALEDGGGRRGDLATIFARTTVCVAAPDETPVVEFLESGPIGATTVILHSTVLPQNARALAEALSSKGVALVEAPVSGGPDRARQGDLTLLLGGAADAVAEVDDVLDALGSRRFHLGEIGAASATKLANQLMMFASVNAAHEALELTGAFGVDRAAALEAISAATGDTWVGRNWGFFDAIVADYDANGTPAQERPWRKDLREFVDAAEAADVAAPLAHDLVRTVGDLIESDARRNEKGGAA